MTRMASEMASDVLPQPHLETTSVVGLAAEYDFIIVGGGTAGLLLAARLSEDSSVQVLVVEAGANKIDDPLINTPGLSWLMTDNPTYQRSFYTVPQEELNGRQLPHQGGRVLGGSSAINHMQMVYSSSSAFDSWEKLGNSGWGWTSMLPYLRKFHTFIPPHSDDKIQDIIKIAHQDEAVASTEGPVMTSYGNADDEILHDWYKTWAKLMSDMKYEGNHLGGYLIPNAIEPKTRTRSYAASAFYSKEIASRSNLRIITEAFVEKIIFQQGTEVVASGVQFTSGSGEQLTIRVKKEVILSAGVVFSPQILELSGIGNPTILKKYGIEVVVYNPNVGENLQDHACSVTSFEVADGVQSMDTALRNPAMMQPVLAMYEKDRSGPLGNAIVSDAETNLLETFEISGKDSLSTILNSIPPSNHRNKELEDSILELLAQPESAAFHHFMSKVQFNVIGQTKMNDVTKPISDGDYFTLFTSLNHPFSRGNIHISSPSNKDLPLIDPKYLSHPMDLELLARQILFLPKLISTTPLSQYFKPQGRRIPEWAALETLEDAKRVVKETCFSNQHWAGTCMMGPKEKGGVVDERLVVYGVGNLRVVDASVFPLMPRGNICSSVYAVAEKAADMIKEDWKLK